LGLLGKGLEDVVSSVFVGDTTLHCKEKAACQLTVERSWYHFVWNATLHLLHQPSRSLKMEPLRCVEMLGTKRSILVMQGLDTSTRQLQMTSKPHTYSYHTVKCKSYVYGSQSVNFTNQQMTLIQSNTTQIYFNPLNAKLNPICHLLALLAHHIFHVSRIRVKGHFNPLNTKLNPICHLLALLGVHHILHISRIRVNSD